MEDSTHRHVRRTWWIVAVLLAVLAAGVAIGRERLGDAWTRGSGLVQVATGIGERRTVRFDEGSRVELSVGSLLRYPKEFSRTSRGVTLVGEGFFVVANDSARPFMVTTGPAVVVAPGGAFGVKAYSGQNTAQVVVDSGVIGVRRAAAPAGSETVLEGGSLARIARDGAINLRDSVDVAHYLEWRRGRIVLDAVPLRGALVEVGRWQNVDLRIGDSVVANRRVTATFASHQTLTEILDGIALQAGARYDRDGRTVTFWLER
jgi:transmembrane sensor